MKVSYPSSECSLSYKEAILLIRLLFISSAPNFTLYLIKFVLIFPLYNGFVPKEYP